jgi:hypothetical protein
MPRPVSPVPAQTEAGKDAKAITKREFWGDMVQWFAPFVKQTAAAHPDAFPHGAKDALIIWDGAKPHTACVQDPLFWKEMQLDRSQLMPHAPCSPDLQAPVEWANGYFKRYARELLRRHREVKNSAQFAALLDVAWTNSNKQETLHASFQRWVLTLKEIVEARGGYPKSRNG